MMNESVRELMKTPPRIWEQLRTLSKKYGYKTPVLYRRWLSMGSPSMIALEYHLKDLLGVGLDWENYDKSKHLRHEHVETFR